MLTPNGALAPLKPPDLISGLVAGFKDSTPLLVPRINAAGVVERKSQAVPVPERFVGKGVAAARVSVGAVTVPPIVNSLTSLAPVQANCVALRHMPTDNIPGDVEVGTLPSN